MNNMDKLLNDMVHKGLASTNDSWIERAVYQRNDKMTLELANSVLLAHDDWDRIILRMQTLN